jgi:hypothetical protein
MPVAVIGSRDCATAPHAACPNSRRRIASAAAGGMPTHDSSRRNSPDPFTMKLKYVSSPRCPAIRSNSPRIMASGSSVVSSTDAASHSSRSRSVCFFSPSSEAFRSVTSRVVPATASTSPSAPSTGTRM